MILVPAYTQITDPEAFRFGSLDPSEFDVFVVKCPPVWVCQLTFLLQKFVSRNWTHNWLLKDLLSSWSVA